MPVMVRPRRLGSSLDARNLGRDLAGVQAYAHVVRPAVILANMVNAPLRVGGKPAHGKGLGITKVKAAVNAPVGGDGKGRDDVGIAAVGIVGGVVFPLAEYLPVETVPTAV